MNILKNINSNICVVAAVKYAEFEQIQKKIDENFTNIGWSTVQHFIKTAPLLHGNFANHFIGHLQTNKVKQLLEYNFELIHSVDSEKLLWKINNVAGQKKKIQKILLQIKTDATKEHGFTFSEVEEKLDIWKKLPNIDIQGLMTIPPEVKNSEENRIIFRQMKKFAEKMDLKELSMGMSDDYEIAIEEGATMVRLGRIIFNASS